MATIVPSLNLFRPAEAEAVTGLSTAMQRDYRHRGFLPSFTGHARFNVFDLAEMYALKQLSDHGFGPDTFGSSAKIVARGLVYHALKFADAYEGEAQDIERFCVESNTPEEKVFSDCGLDTDFRRYLVIWSWSFPHNEHEFTDDLNRSFSEDMKGNKAFLQQSGPVTVYNLKYMGVQFLAQRLEGKAFVRLSRRGD
ncbi:MULTISPECIES: hypothetical protein [unclassified Xanthobacter]|uniref:hypothetical protein n=1 Tax=unclassified Xanthobacter TaxID=2623496 RepID=UPI001EDD1DED|nr:MULTISPECIES: hypothetical protein [unclassified Xanthobacter]